jgi:hypothetical protein
MPWKVPHAEAAYRTGKERTVSGILNQRKTGKYPILSK